MSTTIINDEGEEVVVYTQEEIAAQLAEKEAAVKAEYEAKLAEKDAHVKEKLDQFQQAKKSTETANQEALAAAAEAKKLAEEAKLAIEKSKETELNTRKEFWIQSVVGTDTELKKKVEEAYNLLNLPAGNDTEIAQRVEKAIALAGITAPITPSFSFGGAVAPNFQKSNEQQKQADYDAWKKDLGITI